MSPRSPQSWSPIQLVASGGGSPSGVPPPPADPNPSPPPWEGYPCGGYQHSLQTAITPPKQTTVLPDHSLPGRSPSAENSRPYPDLKLRSVPPRWPLMRSSLPPATPGAHIDFLAPSKGATEDQRSSSIGGTPGAGMKFSVNVRWNAMRAPQASTQPTSNFRTLKTMHQSHGNLMATDRCAASTARTQMLEAIPAEIVKKDDVDGVITKMSETLGPVSTMTREASLQGAKNDATFDEFPIGVSRNGSDQGVARIAESLRMQLAEMEQRTVETAPQSASLSVILRACLFLHGRSVVGDEEGNITTDWARSEILARAFNVYAGRDAMIGLADWMDFVGDTRCCDFDTALLVFQTVAVDKNAAVSGTNSTEPASNVDHATRSEESMRPDLMERLVDLGVYNVRFDLAGFCQLLINLVVRQCDKRKDSSHHSSALESFAQDYVIPAMACISRGATRASHVRLLRDKDAPRVIKTLRDFLPILWRLFTLYAQDEHGNTIPAHGKDFPSIAQAAEHLIAGSEFAALEPMSIDFSSRAARIVSQNPGKHLALAVSEERFVRACQDLSLTPDVAPVSKARAAFRYARYGRLAAHQAKADLAEPDKSNRNSLPFRRIPVKEHSGAMRVTAAHKRRILAVATQTALLSAKKSIKPLATTTSVSASCTPEKPTSLAVSSTTRLRNGEPDGRICCPYLSFCEFIEALTVLADVALLERKVLARKYPTTYSRVAALLAVWGAADLNKLEDLTKCIATHLSDHFPRPR